MKEKYICPKCGSEDIRVPDINSINFIRGVDRYKRGKCGYTGVFMIKEKIEEFK